ncbi:hypothetical protein ABEB36_003908 [Hypothenemus hampei]|uniref:Uncharacterized protein n=1 Tax=Hypothenemus hampei TaxID=57062 RepID=A0ABD1F1K8_HYPHA
MDHLAQDLSIALEQSESCGPIETQSSEKWGMRRRTQSAGNLEHFLCKSDSDESSSSPSELKIGQQQHQSKLPSFHQSDSDDLSLCAASAKAFRKNTSRMRHYGLWNFNTLESDSVNEHSPASRPSFRRKRKFKRMSIEEAPIPLIGKRKRSHRTDDSARGHSIRSRIKPLHQSIVNKIQKFCQPNVDEETRMDTQEENYDLASESSISWSGGEGHEGDDELTDWGPPMDNLPSIDQGAWNSEDSREIRAGCRRLRDERPSFSISTGANERVAKFLQDSTRKELRLCGAERDKLGQLASLYSLDMWFEAAGTTLLRKTSRTPFMQPTQLHHSGHSTHHKKICTHDVVS